MIYPIIVIIVAIGVTALLLLKVTPMFAKMFTDFGSAHARADPVRHRPLRTGCRPTSSTWSSGIAALRRRRSSPSTATPAGRKIFDKLVLKAPIIGPVIRKVAVARFTRTLGTMISSGVPILDALDVTAKTAGNRTIEQGIYYVRGKISEGKNIAGPLLETKVFPPMVVQMIGVGEATGAMDAMLNKIADFYDDEVDTAVAGAHRDDRAVADGLPRRGGRRLPHRDVPADLLDRRCHQVAPSRRRTPAARLRPRLVWVTAFRTAAATLLLAVYGVRLLSRPEHRGAGRRGSRSRCGWWGASTSLVLVQALFLRDSKPGARSALVHVAGDVAIATVLVFLTGGPESPFTFTYLLTVVGASILLGQWGALAAAAACSVSFLVLAAAISSGTIRTPVPVAHAVGGAAGVRAARATCWPSSSPRCSPASSPGS